MRCTSPRRALWTRPLFESTGVSDACDLLACATRAKKLLVIATQQALVRIAAPFKTPHAIAVSELSWRPFLMHQAKLKHTMCICQLSMPPPCVCVRHADRCTAYGALARRGQRVHAQYRDSLSLTEICRGVVQCASALTSCLHG